MTVVTEEKEAAAPRSALIVGAGIAGPALAYWLMSAGWRVTVIEVSATLRNSGQNVDIRGAGVDVMDRMGITEAVRAKNTTELGTSFISLGGRRIARVPVNRDRGDDTFTAEFEVLRSDLVDILVAASGIDDGIRYGGRVSALREADEGVDVEFASGQRDTYDVVVAADGLRSATRTLILGEEITPVSMGVEMSYFTIDRTASDDDDWRWYWAPGRRSASLRPDPHGNIRAILSRVEDHDARQHSRLTIDEQKKHLLEVFADVGWEVPRILDALRSTDDFYFESLAQVKIDRPWWSERGVLLGDAAYCASPVSGMGTTLALVGAYILGAELTTCDDPAKACAAYERTMRPFVAEVQKTALGGSILRYPKTVAGVRLWNSTVAVLFSPPMRKLFSRFGRRHVDDFQLPDYPVGNGRER